MKRRIIALIFSLCIITMLFSGCTKDSATLDLNGKLVPVDTLLKVDNNAISLTEYRYYYLTVPADCMIKSVIGGSIAGTGGIVQNQDTGIG